MNPNRIEIDETARQQYNLCLNAIEKARGWAQGADLDLSKLSDVQLIEAVERRRKFVVAMENSFHVNISRLCFTPAADGALHIMSDSAPLSFYWRYESGYHGGLIFHLSYQDGEPLPAGTWSIHT